ncbi:MAG: adenylate/guanylate cyclase domain-containing protein [Deltaproteobacteria bacterium]|nr:adenylate/guanylate cyclase domain-containing protein [Deltaproteobacteria bacterium]
MRNRRALKLIGLLTMGSLACVFCFLTATGTVWTAVDFKLLDVFYRLAVKQGRGPAMSPQVELVTITDRTYDYFGKNILDRGDLARINDALGYLGTEAVAYDVIFARESGPDSDRLFAESISNLGVVYLPIGLELSPQPRPFKWEESGAYQRLRSDFLRRPVERGSPRPFYASRALMQVDAFFEAAFNSGHISIGSDSDGVYRHMIMVVRIGDLTFPTLTLSMFLDYVGVPFEEVLVDWGNRIVIPAREGGFLAGDVAIPIDDRGRAFVPVPQVWARSFSKMEGHTLLESFKDEDLRGNLMERLEGKFVFIGDVSVGTSDLGNTAIEADVPLVLLHASLLNGMLTRTFYGKWSGQRCAGLILAVGLLLGVSALPRASWVLYLTGGVLLAGLLGLTWMEFTRFRLLPIATVGTSTLFLFFVMVTGLEVTASRERAFIRNAFARYVPEKVVHELLENPELLQLGGEERTMSVLFSDLESFTTISEMLSPGDLVRLLNEYLTEMTLIVLANGGIIDKYQGDSIMAEFGAPLPVPGHADMAVKTGLEMQRRLHELRQIWGSQGRPELRCRVGINTGPMVVGNMGSNQVFDYTVIGDAVNLASRLEGANKEYDTLLMISEFTHAALTPGRFRMRVLDVIRVKGKTRAVKVFEVYGNATEAVSHEDERYFHAYEEGFEAYLSRDFALARERFSAALTLRTEDPASRKMIDRIRQIESLDLPEDWDGSIALTSK